MSGNGYLRSSWDTSPGAFYEKYRFLVDPSTGQRMEVGKSRSSVYIAEVVEDFDLDEAGGVKASSTINTSGFDNNVSSTCTRRTLVAVKEVVAGPDLSPHDARMLAEAEVNALRELEGQRHILRIIDAYAYEPGPVGQSGGGDGGDGEGGGRSPASSGPIAAGAGRALSGTHRNNNSSAVNRTAIHSNAILPVRMPSDSVGRSSSSASTATASSTATTTTFISRSASGRQPAGLQAEIAGGIGAAAMPIPAASTSPPSQEVTAAAVSDGGGGGGMGLHIGNASSLPLASPRLLSAHVIPSLGLHPSIALGPAASSAVAAAAAPLSADVLSPPASISSFRDKFTKDLSCYRLVMPLAMADVSGWAQQTINSVCGDCKDPCKMTSRVVFSEPLAADILYQISLAVLHTHSKKYVNKDLKMENILMFREPRGLEYKRWQSPKHQNSTNQPGDLVDAICIGYNGDYARTKGAVLANNNPSSGTGSATTVSNVHRRLPLVAAADFGIAQREGSNCRGQHTPENAPPEEFNTGPYTGHKYDSWLVGMILANMLLGGGSDLVATVQWKVERRGVENSTSKHSLPNVMDIPTGCGLSDGALHVLRRLLDKNPNTRMSLSELIVDKWMEPAHDRYAAADSWLVFESDEGMLDGRDFTFSGQAVQRGEWFFNEAAREKRSNTNAYWQVQDEKRREGGNTDSNEGAGGLGWLVNEAASQEALETIHSPETRQNSAGSDNGEGGEPAGRSSRAAEGEGGEGRFPGSTATVGNSSSSSSSSSSSVTRALSRALVTHSEIAKLMRDVLPPAVGAFVNSEPDAEGNDPPLGEGDGRAQNVNDSSPVASALLYLYEGLAETKMAIVEAEKYLQGHLESMGTAGDNSDLRSMIDALGGAKKAAEAMDTKNQGTHPVRLHLSLQTAATSLKVHGDGDAELKPLGAHLSLAVTYWTCIAQIEAQARKLITLDIFNTKRTIHLRLHAGGALRQFIANVCRFCENSAGMDRTWRPHRAVRAHLLRALSTVLAGVMMASPTAPSSSSSSSSSKGAAAAATAAATAAQTRRVPPIDVAAILNMAFYRICRILQVNFGVNVIRGQELLDVHSRSTLDACVSILANIVASPAFSWGNTRAEVARKVGAILPLGPPAGGGGGMHIFGLLPWGLLCAMTSDQFIAARGYDVTPSIATLLRCALSAAASEWRRGCDGDTVQVDGASPAAAAEADGERESLARLSWLPHTVLLIEPAAVKLMQRGHRAHLPSVVLLLRELMSPEVRQAAADGRRKLLQHQALFTQEPTLPSPVGSHAAVLVSRMLSALQDLVAAKRVPEACSVCSLLFSLLEDPKHPAAWWPTTATLGKGQQLYSANSRSSKAAPAGDVLDSHTRTLCVALARDLDGLCLSTTTLAAQLASYEFDVPEQEVAPVIQLVRMVTIAPRGGADPSWDASTLRKLGRGSTGFVAIRDLFVRYSSSSRVVHACLDIFNDVLELDTTTPTRGATGLSNTLAFGGGGATFDGSISGLWGDGRGGGEGLGSGGQHAVDLEQCIGMLGLDAASSAILCTAASAMASSVENAARARRHTSRGSNASAAADGEEARTSPLPSRTPGATASRESSTGTPAYYADLEIAMQRDLLDATASPGGFSASLMGSSTPKQGRTPYVSRSGLAAYATTPATPARALAAQAATQAARYVREAWRHREQQRAYEFARAEFKFAAPLELQLQGDGSPIGLSSIAEDAGSSSATDGDAASAAGVAAGIAAGATAGATAAAAALQQVPGLDSCLLSLIPALCSVLHDRLEAAEEAREIARMDDALRGPCISFEESLALHRLLGTLARVCCFHGAALVLQQSHRGHMHATAIENFGKLLQRDAMDHFGCLARVDAGRGFDSSDGVPVVPTSELALRLVLFMLSEMNGHASLGDFVDATIKSCTDKLFRMCMEVSSESSAALQVATPSSGLRRLGGSAVGFNLGGGAADGDGDGERGSGIGSPGSLGSTGSPVPQTPPNSSQIRHSLSPGSVASPAAAAAPRVYVEMQQAASLVNGQGVPAAEEVQYYLLAVLVVAHYHVQRAKVEAEGRGQTEVHVHNSTIRVLLANNADMLRVINNLLDCTLPEPDGENIRGAARTFLAAILLIDKEGSPKGTPSQVSICLETPENGPTQRLVKELGLIADAAEALEEQETENERKAFLTATHILETQGLKTVIQVLPLLDVSFLKARGVVPLGRLLASRAGYNVYVFTDILCILVGLCKADQLVVAVATIHEQLGPSGNAALDEKLLFHAVEEGSRAREVHEPGVGDGGVDGRSDYPMPWDCIRHLTTAGVLTGDVWEEALAAAGYHEGVPEDEQSFGEEERMGEESEGEGGWILEGHAPATMPAQERVVVLLNAGAVEWPSAAVTAEERVAQALVPGPAPVAAPPAPQVVQQVVAAPAPAQAPAANAGHDFADGDDDFEIAFPLLPPGRK